MAARRDGFYRTLTAARLPVHASAAGAVAMRACGQARCNKRMSEVAADRADIE
jgi:hypothetical protein